ncbi:integrase catalytic domain-containing protein [Nephila pilipes]|uniref:Integrase catalytic domain-containing protein n=1 Tax=Nephila pilipes TaxID=299642 RepID=A0A8X6MNU7_NEPPI|nr:integrase catalytic domain-containing protein [Nephila pilipes]
MFLKELPSLGIPDNDSVDSKLLSRRAKYSQRIRDNLRNRFWSEYLGQLRLHALKRDVLQKLCVGDVVLVEDINKRSIHWPLAKITEIFPGRDNVVRLAKVETDNGIFLHRIQRLFLFEISQSEDLSVFQEETYFSRKSFKGSPTPLLLDRSDYLRKLLLLLRL